jgi:hypothetical protein
MTSRAVWRDEDCTRLPIFLARRLIAHPTVVIVMIVNHPACVKLWNCVRVSTFLHCSTDYCMVHTSSNNFALARVWRWHRAQTVTGTTSLAKGQEDAQTAMAKRNAHHEAADAVKAADSFSNEQLKSTLVVDNMSRSDWCFSTGFNHGNRQVHGAVVGHAADVQLQQLCGCH